MKKIAILGSTGSIGENTLKVIKNLNKNGFSTEVVFISSYSNSDLLLRQIKEFEPKAACIIDERSFIDSKQKSENKGCKIVCGIEGIIDFIKSGDYDLLVNALVGFSGLLPTIETIKRGKDVALANKESLVVAGELINKLLLNSNSKLIPIDSEHSAILQCIQGEPMNKVTKITLTASGGPFLKFSKNNLESVTPEQALKHPNWKMGNKITIDSATLMNKGFEIIEGKWLFDIDINSIDVLIHPQSIIHSLIEFVDGSVKAQLGVPDMRLPIQYAITYPDRIASDFPRLKLDEMKSLTFFTPDFDKFECLKIAYDVIKLGGSYPVVLNASNEIAVDLFLKRKIRFTEIPYLIKSALDKNENHSTPDIENILAIDKWSREFVKSSALAGV
jgi:1-deoxy-D-xylulose-5-phosphate reductoisomerase